MRRRALGLRVEFAPERCTCGRSPGPPLKIELGAPLVFFLIWDAGRTRSSSSASRVWAGAEDGGADADFCGALLDGDFEVVGHAHGEDGEREAS